MAFRIDEIIDKRYQIKEIKDGGMAKVYIVEDNQRQEKCALKYLHEGDELSKKRFAREIRLMEKMNSQYVIPIIECGEFQENPYFTMPIAEMSLQEEIDNLNEEKIYSIFLAVCQGIHEIHNINDSDNAIIHRDIKPENILKYRGQYVISDLGIAVDTTRNTQMLTRLDQIIGTPGYIPPEWQLVGSSARADIRSDVYQLGRLLYYMLKKEIPMGELEDFSGIVYGVEIIIRKATEKNPDRRYQSVRELSDAINEYIYNKDISIFLDKKVRLQHNRTAEVSEIINKLTNLRTALKEAKSDKIFERISLSSGNIIYEIVQNAVDANATSVEIIFKDKLLIISNNGNMFRKEDILSLCGVTEGKKEKNKIGRFGIGFKKIFNMAKTVDLYSDDYYVRIVDYIELSFLNEGYEYLAQTKDTYFVIDLEEEGYKEIIKDIDRISYIDFVFLEKLKRFRIRKDKKVIFDYNKRVDICNKKIGSELLTYDTIKFEDKIVVSNTVDNMSERICIIKTQLADDTSSKNYIQLGFRIGENNKLIAWDKTRIYAFLPLNIYFKYGFLISANFNVFQDRSGIEDEKNVELIEYILRAVYESFMYIVAKSYILDYEIFNDNYIDKQNKIGMYINNKIQETIRRLFLEETMFLGADKKYYAAQNLLICEKTNKWKDLINADEIFADTMWVEDDLEKLLFTKLCLIDENSLFYNLPFFELYNKDLINYLKKLEEFIKYKDIDWLIKLYNIIFKDQDLRKALKFRLFLDTNGEFVEIIDINNQQNMYLNIEVNIKEEIKEYITIKLVNKEVISNIKDSIYKHIIPSFGYIHYIDKILDVRRNEYISSEKKLLHNEYLMALKEIINYYSYAKNEKNQQMNIQEILDNKLPIIAYQLNDYSEDGELKKYYVYNGNEKNILIYDEQFCNINLYNHKRAFNTKYSINSPKGCMNYFILDMEFYSSNLEKKEYYELINIIDKMQIHKGIVFDDIEEFDLYNFLIKQNEIAFNNRQIPTQYSYLNSIYMPSIVGIESILENISLDNSVLLWNILVDNYKRLFVKNTYYNYFYRNQKRVQLENELIYLLVQTKWLYNSEQKLVRSEIITVNDLKANGYIMCEELCKLLGISSDSVSKEFDHVVELVRELSKSEKEKLKEQLEIEVQL